MRAGIYERERYRNIKTRIERPVDSESEGRRLICGKVSHQNEKCTNGENWKFTSLKMYEWLKESREIQHKEETYGKKATLLKASHNSVWKVQVESNMAGACMGVK